MSFIVQLLSFLLLLFIIIIIIIIIVIITILTFLLIFAGKVLKKRFKSMSFLVIRCKRRLETV